MAFTELTLYAPISAEEGELVWVNAGIHNLTDQYINVFIDPMTTNVNGEPVEFSGAVQIPPNGTNYWSAGFIMPNKDATLYVECWREIPGVDYIYDSGAQHIVTLEPTAPPPPPPPPPPELYEGTITRKELEYDVSTGSIPVS